MCQQHPAALNFDSGNTIFSGNRFNFILLACIGYQVPLACGSMVLSRRTGILYFCAGNTLCGCNIFAPK
jgi:hypothetical protein